MQCWVGAKNLANLNILQDYWYFVEFFVDCRIYYILLKLLNILVISTKKFHPFSKFNNLSHAYIAITSKIKNHITYTMLHKWFCISKLDMYVKDARSEHIQY